MRKLLDSVSEYFVDESHRFLLNPEEIMNQTAVSFLSDCFSY